MENEENIRWLLDSFDSELLPVATQPQWAVTGSLLPGFEGPVSRFIPGITRSEGLFVGVVRKPGSDARRQGRQQRPLNIIFDGRQPRQQPVAHAELDYADAIAYLRGEALRLSPDVPRGLIEVRFMGQRLGLAKNIGQRANNLYPKEWRIKSSHIPHEYEAILGHT